MRKIMHTMVWINILFFILYSFIQYSNETYNIIHEKKSCIQITKPESMDNQEFIKALIAMCTDHQVDLYYETIQGALDVHPTYYIYKTNVTEQFLPLPLKGRENSLLKVGESLSTMKSLDDTVGQILGSALLQDIEIFEFHALSDYNLDNCIYYTDEAMRNTLVSALLESGYEVAVINEGNFSQEVSTWHWNQEILLFLLLAAMLFYFFSLNREVVIKKINGYSSIIILFDEMKMLGCSILGGFITAEVIMTFIMICFFPASVGNYFAYMLPKVLIFAFVIVGIFVVTGIYVFMQKDASDIKGRSKNREIYVVSLAVKLIIVFIVLFQTSDYISNITNYIKLKQNYSVNRISISDEYYMPFNALSVDINGNAEYYHEQANAFFKELLYDSGNELLISDMSQYLGVTDYWADSYTVMINQNYLRFNPLCDLNGNEISGSNIDQDKLYIFLPDTLKNINETRRIVSNFQEMFSLMESDICIEYYQSVTPLHTFHTDIGDSSGCIYNAIIWLPPDEILTQFAVSLFSERYLMIKGHGKNPYEVLAPMLKKYKIDNVIIESESATEYFESCLFSRKVEALKSIFLLSVLLFIYVITIAFESSVYFVNNSKRIAAMAMQGYGMEIHQSECIQKIIVALLCIIAAHYFSLSILSIGIALLTDLILFLFLARRWTRKNMAAILKGDV